MTTIFNNQVHGFTLQLPYNSSNRAYPDSRGEWIEITKKPNELPTVKLRTIVLYYRNNGNTCTTSEPAEWTGGTTSATNPNYRFYNDYQQGLIENDELESYSGGAKAASNGDGTFNVTQTSTGAKFKIAVEGGFVTSIVVTDTGDNSHMVNDTITIPKVDIDAATNLVITLQVSDINYITNGRQLGWIWGFPLFDVGRNATNWPRFHSCIGNERTGFNGNDISGNETMLVDLSPQRNIIVLDWEGQGGATRYDAIKYGQDQANLVNSFYMTLRVKSSTENLIDYTAGTVGFGKNGHWLQHQAASWPTVGQPVNDKWATLVQYEYECDIIGPKSMLDFTFNRFMFSDDGLNYIGHPIYQSSWANKRVLATPVDGGSSLSDSINLDYGTSKYIVKIITGNNNSQYRLNLSKIIVRLGYTNNNNSTRLRLQLKENWNIWQSFTVITLIGGWKNKGQGNQASERNRGYYGDKWASGNSITDGDADTRRTQMCFTTVTNICQGWKRFITLKNAIGGPGTGNVWTNNNDTDTYEFNNILWCSLQSPRKLPVTKYTNTAANSFFEHRFITNFIDLSANTDNKIVGGGYGRYPNTIDMARESVNPYYSSTAPNNNTVKITEFNVNNDFNYLDAESTPLELDDLNYFKVNYKLLIPPINNETYEITFNMGRSTGAVTTFVRFSDMSGVCSPLGTENIDADRETESITLTWDKDSVNETTGDISMNSIYFTDIASGFNKVTPQFDISGGVLANANNELNYDISFNVFQTHFFSKTGTEINTNRDEIPYTVKAFDNNVVIPQFIDISYVPINYQPYRYINHQIGLTEKKFLLKFDFPFAPMLIKTDGETLKFNIAKWWTKGPPATTLNAKNIDPSGNSSLDTIDIDISYNGLEPVFDNSYSLTNANDLDAVDIIAAATQEIVAIANQNAITNTIQNDDDLVTVPGADTTFSFQFYAPQSLKLGSNFIPDYWRLPDKLNTLYTVNKDPTNPSSSDPYNYYSNWINQIKTTIILDILSIALKSEIGGTVEKTINYLLVNSNKSVRDTNEWDAVLQDGTTLNKTNTNMVFEVQGSGGLTVNQYLNKKPIIVQLSALTTGPFGVNSKAYIGNTAGGNTNGYPPADATRGINVPYPQQTIGSVTIAKNDSSYIVNTFLPNVLRQGNGIGGANLSGLVSGYNGEFDINISAWNDGGSGIQNTSFNGTSISPTPLTVLLVDLSNVIQTNANSKEMINDENNAITINWTSFYFSTLDSSIWDKTTLGDVFWTISRYNLASGENFVVLNEKTLPLNSNNEYTFIDTNIRVYDKFRYTITGKFKWIGIQSLLAGSEIPSINIQGFTTPDCFACKFNRFQYGRYNTTSTNLKLFRPLLINTPQGQVNQFGEKTCGGGCIEPNNPGLSLFSGTTRTSTNNNIYANTTNQLSKKQTYVVLSKNRFRPFR